MRRYVSEVSGDITITGAVRRLQASGPGANGVAARIYLDDAPIHTVMVSPGHQDAISYSVTTTVSVGSMLDFALDPLGDPRYDATYFTATLLLNTRKSRRSLRRK